MRDEWTPKDSAQFSVYLKKLRARREKLKASSKLPTRRRKPLSSDERETVLQKTEGKCHVCGGLIIGGRP